MKSQYRVVIVDGVVGGRSLSYHPAKPGRPEVRPIERPLPTAGTQWRAR